jgi:hypothetical protein
MAGADCLLPYSKAQMTTRKESRESASLSFDDAANKWPIIRNHDLTMRDFQPSMWNVSTSITHNGKRLIGSPFPSTGTTSAGSELSWTFSPAESENASRRAATSR